MAEPARRDALEPPGVSTGRVLLAVAAAFVVMLLTFAAVGGLWWARGRGWREPDPRAFPRPQLETSVATRATDEREAGPRPYRERPQAARAGRQPPPDARLEAAMRETAARGPAAYDPWPEGAR